MEIPVKRQRVGAFDNSYDLSEAKVQNDLRLKSAFESIYKKYGHDFTGIGDDIDLMTGQLVIDNGHVLSMQDDENGFEAVAGWADASINEDKSLRVDKLDQRQLKKPPKQNSSYISDDIRLDGRGINVRSVSPSGQPQRARHTSRYSTRKWIQAEDELLIRLGNQKVAFTEMERYFNGRCASTLCIRLGRICRLQKSYRVNKISANDSKGKTQGRLVEMDDGHSSDELEQGASKVTPPSLKPAKLTVMRRSSRGLVQTLPRSALSKAQCCRQRIRWRVDELQLGVRKSNEDQFEDEEWEKAPVSQSCALRRTLPSPRPFLNRLRLLSTPVEDDTSEDELGGM